MVVEGKTLRSRGAKQPLIYLLFIYQFDICIKISKFQLIVATLEAKTRLSVSALCHGGHVPGVLGKSHEHFRVRYFIYKGGLLCLLWGG